jgi:hypothetical protein
MNFHDVLWETIAEDDDCLEIDSDQLMIILRILMDPVRLNLDDTINLLYPVVYDFQITSSDPKIKNQIQHEINRKLIIYIYYNN